MKLWKKSLAGLIGAVLLTALAAGTALAAESRTKITSVSITIDSDIAVGDSGGSVTATANGSNYDVTDVDIVNDDGEWVDGDVPRVEITLEADSDYYFASMAKSKVSLKGDKATYVSSRREDSSSTLIITVKLDDLEGTWRLIMYPGKMTILRLQPGKLPQEQSVIRCVIPRQQLGRQCSHYQQRVLQLCFQHYQRG